MSRQLKYAHYDLPVSTTTTAPTADSVAVHRIEVGVREGRPDARAQSILRAAQSRGLSPSAVIVRHVYFVEAALGASELAAIRSRLLADPVVESSTLGAATPEPSASVVEVHPLPGVMDPAAQSVRHAIADLIGRDADALAVSTGWRYDFAGLSSDHAVELTRSLLANPVIQQVHTRPWTPTSLPKGAPSDFKLRHIPIRGLSDEELSRMSREAHLFLSLDEMRAVRDEYQALGREPTDIELETIAQTWSEHCVHKTLKSRVQYTGAGDDALTFKGRPGHTVNQDGSVTIENLLKSTVAAATHELIAGGIDWTLSVFKDNSGVIAFDDECGVCIKVETHNHPSALEPYGGSATGAGGCIRDVIGTGLGAKPIANTDVFCVANPTSFTAKKGGESLPPGCLQPRRILTDVVAGVRDYGNRMGIPTVNGAVFFDDRHVGNPLVFCGCIGLIPRDAVHGRAHPGDRIIAIGGRTGRDGIHGATFSSAELEHTAADEFSHAVQIGNAIEEKRVLDAILRARDEDPSGPLYHGLTDCGAGGFSSAVGEMGAQIGASVHLDRAPLKYAGLSYTEIWISEAQERMVLAVPEENLARLTAICREEHVELADLGVFGTPNATLQLHFHEHKVGELLMHFLHEGIPTPIRRAVWSPTTAAASAAASTHSPSVSDALLSLLSHPNIASKHWIVRQYDHEVQGATIIKPLVGSHGRGPGDASVLEPRPGTGRGIAVACGLQTPVGDPELGGDPYQMVLSAVDECVRNLVCVGADPSRTAILDNFCWPSCDKPENLGRLVRACEGCYDAAMAYRTPFISGKDSLNNQLRFDDPATGERRVIEIPPTLLITGLAIVPSIHHCVTMDAKRAGNTLILIGATSNQMGASLFACSFGHAGSDASIPTVDQQRGPAYAAAIAAMIRNGLIESAHDCSEGGMLVAITEMLIATTGPRGTGNAMAGSANGSPLASLLAGGTRPAQPLGVELSTPAGATLEQHEIAFNESPSRYVVEVAPENLARVRQVLRDYGERVGGLFHSVVGHVTSTGRLVWPHADLNADVNVLADTWLAPLDW